MAATLTADGELTFFSFPIEKQEETGDGDVIVYGKATDGTVDSDLQIVDQDWSAKAIQDWLDSGGNVRVQHQARRDPAGKGLAVEVTPDGHYVKALIVEPVAKQLVKKGVLTAYSVGIAHPDIRPDPTGKAMNGIITGRRDGHTKISEISLVDRGSNFNSRFQLVKAAGNGVEFVGKMLDVDDADVVSISAGRYSPSDLAKLLAHKAAAATIEKRNFDANVGGGVDRDQLKDSDFAGPDRSFPIVTPGDVSDAASSLGRTKHDPAQVKRNIISIAHRKGQAFVDQLPDSWQTASKADGADDGADCKTCDGSGKILEGHRDCPDCKGKSEPEAASNADLKRCPHCNVASEKKNGKCVNCGKDLGDAKSLEKSARKKLKAEVRAALLKSAAKDDADDDGDDGDDDKPSDTVDAGSADDGQEGAGENSDSNENDSVSENSGDDSKTSKKTARAKVKKGKRTIGDTPGKDVTATKPVPDHREPDGAAVEAFESDAGLPTDADSDPGVGVGGPEGIGVSAGKAASPEVGATLRLRSLGVPTELGKLHDLTCPCFHPSAVAKAWPLASLADVDDEYWAQKALDTAASASFAEAAATQRLWQHVATLKGSHAADVLELQLEAHKAFADANPGPGSAPSPSELTPARFKRPYLSAGHAAQSPGASGPNTAPITAGQITASQFDRGFLDAGHAADSPANKAVNRTFYTNAGRDQTRQAMVAMHDHLAATFPDLCPAVTAPAGAKKEAPPTPRDVATPTGNRLSAVPRAVGKTRSLDLVEKLVKRLEKDVLKGRLTLDEAQARLAEVTQGSPTEVAEKAAQAASEVPEVTKAVTSGLGAAEVEALVTKAVAAAVASRDEAHAVELTRLEKTLKKQGKLIERLAEEPAPNGPYRGLPILQPIPTQPPVAVQKSSAERSREALTQLMLEQWRTNPDPSQREAAWAEISKMMQ